MSLSPDDYGFILLMVLFCGGLLLFWRLAWLSFADVRADLKRRREDLDKRMEALERRKEDK